MLFEGVQEFVKYIFFSFLAKLNIRVVLCVVAALQVFNVNVTVTISIEPLKSQGHNVSSSVTHPTNNSPEELIVVNLSISISIELLEYSANLLRILADSVVSHGLGELLTIKRLRFIVVHDLENTFDAVYTTSAS